VGPRINRKHLGLIAAILAVGVAAVSLYFGVLSRSPRINLDPYQVLGAVVAEETAKLLGNKGQIVVLARDTTELKTMSLEAELKSFRQTVKKSTGLSVVATERIRLTPMMMLATGGAVPPEELFKALQAHPKVGAVVLFFAFPPLADEDLDALKQSGAKFVVVSAYRLGYQRLLERQAIHLAIVPRGDAPPAATQKPQTLRERFDQEYLIITPDKVAEPQP
jgi:hypothetical protein